MLVKICFSSLDTAYITDVQSVAFHSYLNDDSPVYNRAKDALDCECKDVDLYISDEYLNAQFSCSPVGNTDEKYFVNFMKVKFNKNAGTPQQKIAFTGRAYLCDDSGKTVDTITNNW